MQDKVIIIVGTIFVLLFGVLVFSASLWVIVELWRAILNH